MKDPIQVGESIERFRQSFWNRQTIDRPPLGISPDRSWLPIGYLKRTPARDVLEPDDIGPALARSDYEDVSYERRVRCDDWLPYNAAWRAVPWLEAIAGCPVRYATGSLAPGHIIRVPGQWEEAAFPASLAWLERLRLETCRLVAEQPYDGWISPTILRGPSDVLSAMRGLSEFYLDLYDVPDTMAAAAARVNRLLLAVLDMHFALVPEKLAGYGYIYGYWAPGRSVVIQEDALGMCSPAIYRDIFMPLSAEVVAHLGPYVMFHLHSTGYRHYRHILDVPGIAGLQMTVEANGPSLEAMLPALQEILARTRLILFVDSHFEQLKTVVRQLPRDGLYLVVSDKFVSSDHEFLELAADLWR
jgi:hypothetical protein